MDRPPRHTSWKLVPAALVVILAACTVEKPEIVADVRDAFRWVRAEGPVAYYVNPQTLYDLASRPVPGVVYGFYRERFFAVYILLSAPDQFHHLERTFTGRYGPPRIATASSLCRAAICMCWNPSPEKSAG